MSRHGCDGDADEDWLGFGRWRGAVRNALKGARGQAFLRELANALDAMPDKRLGRDGLIDDDTGCACTLGVIAQARGLRIDDIDDYELRDKANEILGIANAMATEIMCENDEGTFGETPEARWLRMRKWVAEQLQVDTSKV